MSNLCGKCGYASFSDFVASTSCEGELKRPRSPATVEDDNFWIQCDICESWFHGNCVDVEEYECVFISEYHCPDCQPKKGPSQLKQHLNRHRYQFFDRDAETKTPQIGTESWIRTFKKEQERFPACVEKVKILESGNKLTEQVLRKNNWDTPIVVRNSDGLNLKLPANLTVEKLVESLGCSRKVDVIDVYRQHSFRMSLGRFLQHWNEKPRSKLYNIVSLEVSKTMLNQEVHIPKVVEDISWVHHLWPRDNSGVEGEEFYQKMKPEVGKFCLLGMKDSFTDFHIDFGGSSVWYHVYRGKKVFYIIEPSDRNLASFERHSTDPGRSEKFFGDELPHGECRRLEVNAGETLFIPGGWIHAVWTPIDSLVFGGNFLHSLHIPMQLRINDMEERLNTDERFMFPSFQLACFVAAKHLMETFHDANDAKTLVDGFLLAGTESLLQALNDWIKRDKESKRKSSPLFFDHGKTIRALQKEVNAQEKLKSQRKNKTWKPKKMEKGIDERATQNKRPKNTGAKVLKGSTEEVTKSASKKVESIPSSKESQSSTLKLKLSLSDVFPAKVTDSASSSIISSSAVVDEAIEEKKESVTAEKSAGFRFCPLKPSAVESEAEGGKEECTNSGESQIRSGAELKEPVGFSLVRLQQDREQCTESTEKKGLSLLIKKSQKQTASISPIKIAKEINAASASKSLAESPSSGLDISGIFGTSSHGRVQKPSKWVTGGATSESPSADRKPWESTEFVPELGQRCRHDDDFVYPSLIDSDTEEQGSSSSKGRKRKSTQNESRGKEKAVFSIVASQASLLQPEHGNESEDCEKGNLVILEKPNLQKKTAAILKAAGRIKKSKGGATVKQRLASKMKLRRFNMQI